MAPEVPDETSYRNIYYIHYTTENGFVKSIFKKHRKLLHFSTNQVGKVAREKQAEHTGEHQGEGRSELFRTGKKKKLAYSQKSGQDMRKNTK